jgi:membrane protein required for colicin V production
MNWLDIVILVPIGINTFVGLGKGLIKMVLSLVGVILGVVLAGQFYDTVGSWLSFLGNEDIANALGFILILGVVMVAAEILGTVIKKMVSIALLGWVDRIGGAVLGALIAVIIVSAGLAIWAKFFGSDTIADSAIASFLLDKFPLVLGLLPTEFDSIKDFFQ